MPSSGVRLHDRSRDLSEISAKVDGVIGIFSREGIVQNSQRVNPASKPIEAFPSCVVGDVARL